MRALMAAPAPQMVMIQAMVLDQLGYCQIASSQPLSVSIAVTSSHGSAGTSPRAATATAAVPPRRCDFGCPDSFDTPWAMFAFG